MKRHVQGLKTLVEHTVRKTKAGQVGARALSNIAHGAAAHRIKDESIYVLFRALAREAERRVKEFIARDLANTAWAFAKVNLSNEKLFAALARDAEWWVQKFNVQGLANML